MQRVSLLSNSALAAIATTALTLASPLLSLAEENSAPTDAKPALKLQVIDGVEVKFPGRSIFYQRVVPPVAPVARVPVVVPEAKPLSLAESVAAEARANKRSAVLMLSATVYDQIGRAHV